MLPGCPEILASRLFCLLAPSIYLPFTLLVGRGHACKVIRACYQSYLEVILGSGVVMASLGPCQTASAELASWL